MEDATGEGGGRGRNRVVMQGPNAEMNVFSESLRTMNSVLGVIGNSITSISEAAIGGHAREFVLSIYLFVF